MTTYNYELQKEIIAEMKVLPEIEPAVEIERRVDFLREFLRDSGLNGFVLGLSGGQDSTLAGKLAQMACIAEGKTFVAMKLPYGVQRDACDVDLAIDFIQPDEVIDFNIKTPVDAACETYQLAIGKPISDYHKGNIKARERMLVQYAIAGDRGLAVVGTDHAAENVMGFYTKGGDGQADILPNYGLNKRQGAMLLRLMNGPEKICTKAPTADLLDNNPGRPDEEELKIVYPVIDNFLEGKIVSQDEFDAIISQYRKTQHKRRPPITLYD